MPSLSLLWTDIVPTMAACKDALHNAPGQPKRPYSIPSQVIDLKKFNTSLVCFVPVQDVPSNLKLLKILYNVPYLSIPDHNIPNICNEKPSILYKTILYIMSLFHNMFLYCITIDAWRNSLYQVYWCWEQHAALHTYRPPRKVNFWKLGPKIVQPKICQRISQLGRSQAQVCRSLGFVLRDAFYASMNSVFIFHIDLSSSFEI